MHESWFVLSISQCHQTEQKVLAIEQDKLSPSFRAYKPLG